MTAKASVVAEPAKTLQRHKASVMVDAGSSQPIRNVHSRSVDVRDQVISPSLVHTHPLAALLGDRSAPIFPRFFSLSPCTLSLHVHFVPLQLRNSCPNHRRRSHAQPRTPPPARLPTVLLIHNCETVQHNRYRIGCSGRPQCLFFLRQPCNSNVSAVFTVVFAVRFTCVFCLLSL